MAHRTRGWIRFDAPTEMHSGKMLQHLSSLTALQELKLCMPITSTLEGITHLSRLTWLLLDSTPDSCARQYWQPEVAIPAGKLPTAISKLTSLQRLQLRHTGELNASLLDGMPELRHLELTGVTFSHTEALLAAVGRTQQLTYLWWAFEGRPAFSFRQLLLGLRPKSTLVHLHVSDLVTERRPSVWAYRGLPSQLRGFSWLGQRQSAFPLHELPTITDTCLRLQELALSYTCNQPLSDGGVGALRTLPDLMRLVLSEQPFAGYKKHGLGLVGLVANLTQLRDLELFVWGEPAKSELMGLTQLVCLTRLVYKTDERERRVVLNKV